MPSETSSRHELPETEEEETAPQQTKVCADKAMDKRPPVDIPTSQEPTVPDSQSSPNSRSPAETFQSEAPPKPQVLDGGPLLKQNEKPMEPQPRCKPKRESKAPVWMKDYVST